MKESFDKAFEILMNLEGYTSNEKYDKGGLTVYGISEHYFPNDIAKIKTLDKDDAKEYAKQFYKTHFWNKYKLDKKSTPYDIVYFCQLVNSPAAAIRCNNIDQNIDKFLDCFRRYYTSLVSSNPTQKKFYKGWLNRLDKLKRSVSFDD